MGWKVYGMGRSFEGEDMDRELEKAYKGYRDAMEEMDGRYGERGMRRRMDDDGRIWDDDDEYGERRGVKGTGPYARRRR